MTTPARPISPAAWRAALVAGVVVAAAGCLGDDGSRPAADTGGAEDTSPPCGGCPTGKTCCESRFEGDVPRCVDTALNPEHCGVCGHLCDGACAGSGCVDAPACSAAAPSCPGDLRCSTSATGPDGQGRCCPPGTQFEVSIADFMGCCPDGDDCGCTQGMCPISVRSAKADIRYLAPSDLDALRRELLGVRLATYRYAQDERRQRRLGFIIDDGPPQTSVAADGAHVDLYGYASLAVAALQSQARELDALHAEVDALRREVEQLRAALSAARP